MQRYILSKKLYLTAGVYFLLTTILHWRLHPDLGIILYLVGAFIGLHLLEAMETAVGMTPSPFRTVFSQVLLWILLFFILTSSALPLGKGVALFLNGRLAILQIQAQRTNTLDSWFRQSVTPTATNIRIYNYLIYTVFIVASLLFVLV